MSKNRLGLIAITFIVLVIAFFTYNSYKNGQNISDNKINNYYDIEYLFNSNYIKIANTIKDYSDSEKIPYIYAESDKLYIKTKDKINEIDKLPLDATIFYNKIDDDNYEFISKTKDGDIYYSNSNLPFSLIGENIKDIYIPTYDKEGILISDTSGFIVLDNDNVLKYIVSDNKKYVLKDDLEVVKPYYNYICFKNIILYQTFNNELEYNNTRIKDEDNNSIFVKEMFAILEKLDKESYIFKVYIIDEDSFMYLFEVNSNNFSNPVTNLKKQVEKVEEVNYVKENDSIKEIKIKYENGKSKVIGKDKEIITSTVYDRKNL